MGKKSSRTFVVGDSPKLGFASGIFGPSQIHGLTDIIDQYVMWSQTASKPNFGMLDSQSYFSTDETYQYTQLSWVDPKPEVQWLARYWEISIILKFYLDQAYHPVNFSSLE